MKVRLTFKTPDVIDYALEDVSAEEAPAAREAIEKFVHAGEYATIEIDTETKTATVLVQK